MKALFAAGAGLQRGSSPSDGADRGLSLDSPQYRDLTSKSVMIPTDPSFAQVSEQHQSAPHSSSWGSNAPQTLFEVFMYDKWVPMFKYFDGGTDCGDDGTVLWSCRPQPVGYVSSRLSKAVARELATLVALPKETS